MAPTPAAPLSKRSAEGAPDAAFDGRGERRVLAAARRLAPSDNVFRTLHTGVAGTPFPAAIGPRCRNPRSAPGRTSRRAREYLRGRGYSFWVPNLRYVRGMGHPLSDALIPGVGRVRHPSRWSSPQSHTRDGCRHDSLGRREADRGAERGVAQPSLVGENGDPAVV